MTDLPEPLTPEYCDLRGYDFMPLFGHRLFSSEFYTEASDAEFRAGMRLWWAAWNQLPAGSLPNSDRALATLADFGRDVEAWQRVKERALHGFILCSDGRLYHPMLCQEALDAYEERLRKSKKRLKDKERLQSWREMRRKQDSDSYQSDEPTNNEMEMKRVSPAFQEHIRNACVAENARGDRDRDSKDTLTSFVTPAAPSSPDEAPPTPAPVAPEAKPPTPLDQRSVLFGIGSQIVGSMTGKPPKATKALIGKWLRDVRDDCAVLNGIIQEAADTRPADPVAWITKAVKARGSGRAADRSRRWALDGVDLDALAEEGWKEMGL